ncbi:unnamed protein product [Arabidopsis halleri]
MDLTKTSITFFLIIILAISSSNYNVLAVSGPPKCIAQCRPGYYERFECFHDCITEGYDNGRCVPGPKTGKCCCTR